MQSNPLHTRVNLINLINTRAQEITAKVRRVKSPV